MSYLAKLKELEDENISSCTPDIKPPKLPKPPFVSYGSSTPEDKSNNFIGINAIESGNENVFTDKPETVLPKPTKVPYGSFDSSSPGDNEKNFSRIEPGKTLKPDPLEGQREARRLKVIALLEENPGTKRAVFTDSDSDPQHIIITIAVRHVATVELLVDRAKYDGLQLLDLIEKQSMITH